jgi:hypothetical protein
MFLGCATETPCQFSPKHRPLVFLLVKRGKRKDLTSWLNMASMHLLENKQHLKHAKSGT